MGVAVSADGDHGVLQRGPEKRRQRDGQDQERDRQHGVGDAADDGVDPAAAVARQQPDRHAEPERDRDRDDAGQQRGARAEDHAREEIAARFVGAEPVLQRGRLADRRPALLGRVVGRDQRREDGDQHEQHDDDEAEHRALALQQTPPGARARALLAQLDDQRCSGNGHRLAPEPGVDQHVGDVGQQVEQDVGGGRDQGDALHHLRSRG